MSKKKVQKKVSAIKRRRSHLEQWGLDSAYTYSLALAGHLTTSGWAAGAVYRRRYNDGAYTLLNLTFSEVKHEKEISQKRDNADYPQFGPATPFIFGKINNLYLLQIGYGREKLLIPKVLEGSVSIGFRYSGGFSLALMKPYHLRLLYFDTANPSSTIQKEERYNEFNREVFLNVPSILGKAKWQKGIEALEYVPGAYAQAAFTLESAKSKAFVQTVAIGGDVSIYTKATPTMALEKGVPWQARLFVGIELGKRWK